MDKQSRSGILLAMLWLIISIIISHTITANNEATHYLYTILCCVSYVLCFYSWLKFGGRISSLYVFFIAYLMFNNMGQSILYILKVPSELLYLYFKLDVGEVANMLRFQNLCIAALNLGTLLYVSKPGNCVTLLEMQDGYDNNSITSKNTSRFDQICIFLLAISLLYLFYEGFGMLIMRQSMSYHDFFESGRGQTSNEFTRFIRFAAPFFSMWAIFKKKYVKVVYASLIILVCIYMLTGARGLSITYVAILLLMAPITHRNLFQRKYILVWSLVGLFAFSLLGVIGNNRNDLNSNIFSSSDGITANIITTLAEMGGSARSAVYAIDAADHGVLNYRTIPTTLIRAVIPMSSRLSEMKQNNVGLSDWITDYADNSSSGLGFSCIGELYVNFGKFGWIFMLLYGYFIAYAENESYRRILKGDLLYPLFLLTFLCTMIPWARSEFVRCLNVVRYGLYFILGKFFIKG